MKLLQMARPMHLERNQLGLDFMHTCKVRGVHRLFAVPSPMESHGHSPGRLADGCAFGTLPCCGGHVKVCDSRSFPFQVKVAGPWNPLLPCIQGREGGCGP